VVPARRSSGWGLATRHRRPAGLVIGRLVRGDDDDVGPLGRFEVGEDDHVGPADELRVFGDLRGELLRDARLDAVVLALVDELLFPAFALELLLEREEERDEVITPLDLIGVPRARRAPGSAALVVFLFL